MQGFARGSMLIVSWHVPGTGQPNPVQKGGHRRWKMAEPATRNNL
jgi:hypothetical protein